MFRIWISSYMCLLPVIFTYCVHTTVSKSPVEYATVQYTPQHLESTNYVLRVRFQISYYPTLYFWYTCKEGRLTSV